MAVTHRVASLATALLVSLQALPSSVGAQPAMREYADRRSALLATIDSGVIVAFGGVEPVAHWPRFFQTASFQYLTGFPETDAALLMVKRNGATRAMMFVPSRSAMEARWVGSRTTVSDIPHKVLGVEGRDIADLVGVADSLARAGMPIYVVSDVQTIDYADQDSLSRGSRFLSTLNSRYPRLKVESRDSVVLALRAKKSAAEIGLLRKATEITVKAHQEAMKAVAPGCGEWEIQALMEGVFQRMGGDRPGYSSIVGSGPNATVLHYSESKRVMKDGELLLIDAASSFDHYSSDVTRTMPVNGRFTQAQKEIYQLVRDAQEAFVRQIKPGSSYMVSNDSGRTLIQNGLVRLGLIESADATYDPIEGMNCPPTGCKQRSLFATHGYGGHGIGLDVHDPAQYQQAMNFQFGNFQPGDVFTVEPGLYVDPDYLAQLPDTPRNRAMLVKIRPAVEKYKWIGVRIEDAYALTDRGLERLSVGAPREITEIEALMARPEPALPGGGGCGRTVS